MSHTEKAFSRRRRATFSYALYGPLVLQVEGLDFRMANLEFPVWVVFENSNPACGEK